MTDQKTTALTGDGIAAYQALAIAAGLRFYARTGRQINRAYTPTRMLRFAERITGKKFKRGQYVEAESALREFVFSNKPEASPCPR